MQALNLATATLPIRIEPEGDAAVSWRPLLRAWRLERTFVYYDGLKGGLITIRRGFLSDLASIPRLVWSIPFLGIASFELGTSPPVTHDALYRSGGRSNDWVTIEPLLGGASVVYTRDEADELFHRMMAELDVAPWKRGVAYRMVRALGWRAWTGEE